MPRNTSTTRRQPTPTALAAAVLAALGAWCSGSAHADSAVGVDTALGNGLNPTGRPAVPRDLAGDDSDTVRRSPSGQLYGLPYAVPDLRSRTAGGWEVSGSLAIGVLGGDADVRASLLRKYKDLDRGLALDHFEAEADLVGSGHYVQAVGGGLGRDDQYLGVQFGRANDWKVKLFYNGTSHVFTDSYKPLFVGAGSGRLTLAGGLQPLGGALPVLSGSPTVGTGSCTAVAPCWSYTGADGVNKVFSGATALAGINWTGSATTAAGTPVSANSIAGSINHVLETVDGDTELGLVRRKLGASAELRLNDRWKAYASLTREHRTGTRPFGMNENNYTVEIPEPIDYLTHDFLAGLGYTDRLTQLNLRASASLFRNQISTLTVQQPWLAAATGIAAAQTTIFDLYPDNNAFNLKGEFARNLPDFYKGRVTASAAWTSTRQDDTLLMPVDPSQTAQVVAATGSSIIGGIQNPGYASGTLDLKNWDGSNGSPLSQSSARQRIDSRMLNLGLLLQPLDDLQLKADLRSFATDNKGGYTAYNPLTGQFGRGFRNSTAFDLVVGSSGAAGAIGVPCLVPAGFVAPAGCTFNGVAGVPGQSTNNPANVPVVNPAREIRQNNATLAADFDLGRSSTVNAAFEREDIHRTFREREKTWENKLRLGYVNRGFELATLRLSFEDGRRGGSAYEFWPVGDFGTGLSGLDWNTLVTRYLDPAAPAGWLLAPANLAGYLARYAYESRKFDQADRNQQVFNARLNLAPREDVDVGLAVQRKDITYPDSGYGLQTDRNTSFNLDIAWQPDVERQVFAYYSWQDGKRALRANSGTSAAAANNTCTFPAGSALTVDEVVAQCAQQIWLAASQWDLDTTDRTAVIGVGMQASVGKAKAGFDLVHTISRTGLATLYGANVLTPAQALLAGAAFPDMRVVQNTLSTHLMIPIDKRLSAHLMFRHESGTVTDWHYQGMPIGASAAENQATLMLDAGAQSFHANIVGVFLQFKL